MLVTKMSHDRTEETASAREHKEEDQQTSARCKADAQAATTGVEVDN